MATFIEVVQPLFEQALFENIQSLENCEKRLQEALLYACQTGGKRVRPMIVLAVSQFEQRPIEEAFFLATAIEMVHTYSLIHDDLPGMDNDDFRRGKPTVDKQFDEATAILAGDALLTESFRMITRSSLSDSKKVQAVTQLVAASGTNGMISGQMRDIESEHKEITLQELQQIHEEKTGQLLKGALELGLLQLEHPKRVATPLRTFMNHFGLAFQIQNDLQDVLWDASKTGKQTGKDAALEKNTYPSLLGIEGAKAALQSEIQSAKAALQTLPQENKREAQVVEFFETLLKYVEI